MKEDLIINGVRFSNPEEAKKAKKELEGIQYIRQKNDMENPIVLLALYNKFAERNLFQTKIGLEFLNEIKQELIKNPKIKKEEIFGYEKELKQEKEERKKKDITNNKEKRKEEEKRKREEEKYKYKYKYYNSFILNILFLITIIIMVIITLGSKNITILNYKNKILDEYSNWEMQLQQKEKELNEREKQLREQ